MNEKLKYHMPVIVCVILFIALLIIPTGYEGAVIYKGTDRCAARVLSVYNDNIIDVLKEEDYKLAFTFGPSKNHRKMYYFDNNYKIPRLNISNDMPLWKFKLRLKLPF